MKQQAAAIKSAQLRVSVCKRLSGSDGVDQIEGQKI